MVEGDTILQAQLCLLLVPMEAALAEELPAQLLHQLALGLVGRQQQPKLWSPRVADKPRTVMGTAGESTQVLAGGLLCPSQVDEAVRRIAATCKIRPATSLMMEWCISQEVC